MNVLSELKKIWPRAEWEGDTAIVKLNVGSVWILVSKLDETKTKTAVALEDFSGDSRYPMWTMSGDDLAAQIDGAYKALLRWAGQLVNFGSQLQHIAEPHLFRQKSA